MATEWDRLREFDGSVENAFEELCAQLARIDSETHGYRFVRNGKPDGGLECYAIRPDGTTTGWQAKWFRSAPTSKQWAQITDSFKRAVAAYPSLTRFIICLPQDRGTSCGTRKLPMEQWQAHVAKWKSNAKRQGRHIDFEYWGTSEIFTRLSDRKQAGRHKFWFTREFLTPEWFRERFEEAWENNRRRYRPELNVDVPGLWWFDALLQTPEFLGALRKRVTALWEAIRRFDRWSRNPDCSPVIAELQSVASRIAPLLNSLPRSAEDQLDTAQIKALLTDLTAVAHTILNKPPASASEAERGEWNHAYYMMYSTLHEISEYTEGVLHVINESRALLVLGNAGQGKTHTLCKISDERTRSNLPAVLSFGINFTKGDPWTQLIQSLGLTCDRDQFLGAMNAAGEAAQTRALIIIDAINESDDPTLWRRSLPGMLRAIRDYAFVSLAFSLRNEFVTEILPDGLRNDEAPRVQHPGFRGEEARATARIFEHFGLSTPQIPLLDPEFSNPLFVITLAESLYRSEMNTIPAGATSMRWLCELWLNVINQRLATPEHIDYNVEDRRVHRAVANLAGAMARIGTKRLDERTARELVEKAHRSNSWSKSLFRALLDEDVIQRVSVFDPNTRRSGRFVRFTFDRFADHLIIQFLLNRIRDSRALKSAFRSRGRLWRLLARKLGKAIWIDPGLLLALAIEIPEDPRFHCELGQVLVNAHIESAVRRATLDGMVWRSPESITKAATTIVRRELRRMQAAPITEQCDAIRCLLPLTTHPGHPLNADFLDTHLRTFRMAQRDYWWSRPLSQMDSDTDLVMRLINWMWSDVARAADDDTTRLSATVATWFFATSNRFIRDKATKAIVSMLINRPAIAAKLIDRFLSTDDPYVVERVLGVGYGVALRTHDSVGLGVLANLVYARCFRGKALPEHLLARDYARGIVETAVRRQVLTEIDSTRLKPPYTSSWPRKISRYEDWEEWISKGSWQKDRGLRAVWCSINEDGDFGRYVIGTNGHPVNWLRYRLGESLPIQLTTEDHDDRALQLAIDCAIIEKERARAEETDAKPEPIQYATPKSPPHPCHAPSGRPLTRTEIEYAAWFPRRQIQCMVMDDVLALGYTSRLDDDVRPHGADGQYIGRIGPKSERLGKKYQWIALHRTYARIADRFQFVGDSNIQRRSQYVGPWQISHGRDIDPSCLLRYTVGRHYEPVQPCWWAPFNNAGFDHSCEDLEWIKNTSILPTMEHVCESVDPQTRQRWIIGSQWMHLTAPKPTGPVSEGQRQRTLWYGITGVFVRANESARLVAWLNRRRKHLYRSRNELLPTSPHLSECFLGEFPNSPAWDAENDAYYGRDPWAVGDGRWGPPPIGCSLLADGYFEDGHTDCGRDETLEFDLPSAEIISSLNLRHASQDGHFEDASGRLVAWDPSITQRGPSALLIDRNALIDYARTRRYHILLLVYGEKGAHGDFARQEQYLGRLAFSGVLLHDGKDWKGSIDARFEPPR